MKKFTVNLTDEEHARLKKAAKKHDKPMSKLLRIYLRIGLISEDLDKEIVLRRRQDDTILRIV